MNIEVRKPKKGELEELGILTWPTWSCEPSTFDWTYSDRETCYLIEGKVTVETEGESVSFAAGDIVVFPKGLACVWKVSEGVKKHYNFG
ncbi:cupin domain-containing protein [Candidatus Riflebacteria bacterium]